ncbi:Lipase 2 precursor [Corynebacterium capitovis DSM 44611]|uniref:GDSL-type esterase/lipase family protein n=1 Tax=Corynebacterium capitovis TaxID=131081 RepID=UPI0003718D24|nr:GDSL-type esterase/lipase family protein [Corynebacterium capitovis]WKD57952.1 Lipase 2 precursor [Corynebacterium capitovis DSM 44611]
MTFRSFLRAVTTAGAAALATVGLCVSAGPAQAQPGADVVVFGDSYVSNPDQVQHTILRLTGALNLPYPGTYTNTGGCLQSDDNWPRQMQAITGRRVADWSCSGANSAHVLSRVEQAIHAGDLNAGTRAVAIAAGFNDYWPGSVIQFNTRYDQGLIERNYVSNVQAAVTRVRSVAPEARIIIPGMLSLTEPYGAHMVCFINVVPNLPGGIPSPLLQQVEELNRSNQIAAAAAVGGQFVDIKGGSSYHNSCAKDAQRWVAGSIDTTTSNYHMSFHPNFEGSRFVANEVAAVL